MRAPTVAGRKLMDQIDGFKMYLETAEKNRLNYVDKGEPPMTVPRFESILPFAIALGVEKLWSQRFEGDLARNAVAGVTSGSYSPLWYTGHQLVELVAGLLQHRLVDVDRHERRHDRRAAQLLGSSGFPGGGGGGSAAAVAVVAAAAGNRRVLKRLDNPGLPC